MTKTPWVKVLGKDEWHFAPLDAEHTNTDVSAACGVRVAYTAIERVEDAPEGAECDRCETCVAKAKEVAK